MEQWKDIPDFFGYQASTHGRVRSVPRVIETKRGSRRLSGTILSPAKHSTEHPYPYVQLRVNGRAEMRGVHVLVAMTFIGVRPDGYYVCHKDGSPENNNLTNLYYGSPTQNQYDRREHGTLTIGEKHPMAKITIEDVRKILERLASGERQKDIGADFGITQSQVSNIKNKKLWKEVTGVV